MTMQQTAALLLMLMGLAACQKRVHTTPTPTPHARTVALSWSASITSGVTYNVYRAPQACTARIARNGYTKINAEPVAGLTYSDPAVPAGTYCYYATSYLAGASPPESEPSNKAQADVTDSSCACPPINLTVAPPEPRH